MNHILQKKEKQKTKIMKERMPFLVINFTKTMPMKGLNWRTKKNVQRFNCSNKKCKTKLALI